MENIVHLNLFAPYLVWLASFVVRLVTMKTAARNPICVFLKLLFLAFLANIAQQNVLENAQRMK